MRIRTHASRAYNILHIWPCAGSEGKSRVNAFETSSLRLMCACVTQARPFYKINTTSIHSRTVFFFLFSHAQRKFSHTRARIYYIPFFVLIAHTRSLSLYIAVFSLVAIILSRSSLAGKLLFAARYLSFSLSLAHGSMHIEERQRRDEKKEWRIPDYFLFSPSRST